MALSLSNGKILTMVKLKNKNYFWNNMYYLISLYQATILLIFISDCYLVTYALYNESTLILAHFLKQNNVLRIGPNDLNFLEKLGLVY